MKNTHPHTKLLAVIFIGVVIMLLWKVIDAKKMQMYDQSNQITAPQQLQTYRSDLMKFSINYVGKYRIFEDDNYLSLKPDDGEILILKTNTNYSNAKDYVLDLEKKNNLILSDMTELTINDLGAIKGLTTKINNQNRETEKLIFIFADYRIFTFSTTSPELYDDLDAIAQSFRYTP